jgi:hypothetical protein
VTQELNRIVENEGKINFEKGGTIENEIRAILAKRLRYDPDDKEAISMWNTALSTVFFNKMISSMNDFFVAVSLITLSWGHWRDEHHLVSVKERTREIGIRKVEQLRNVQRQFSVKVSFSLFEWKHRTGHRRRPLRPCQPAAIAGAVCRHDDHIARSPLLDHDAQRRCYCGCYLPCTPRSRSCSY